VRRDPDSVIEEIVTCTRRGIHSFAFYDDALLADGGRHLSAILEGVIARKLRVTFHTPNGLHARSIPLELSRLMRRAGFETLRLSLETIDPGRQEVTGGKVTTGDFVGSVANLKKVGFSAKNLGVYVLAGLPGVPLLEVEQTVRFVHSLGLQAKLALFSPIPGTLEGDRALPPGADPLLHNNTVYPYLLGEDHVRALARLKLLAKDGNSAVVRGIRQPA
jgi:radical SAM superfamily enzyme YgiQ (UPF0313 family)